MIERKAKIQRDTKETKIKMELDLDGKGTHSIHTGIGFFDHMLTHIAAHGFFDFKVEAEGDLEVDCHHTIEDIGIVFGQCLKEALQDKKGIKRYGSRIIPMDETLVLCALDLSGRTYLNFDVDLPAPTVGEMDTEMVEEFFRAVASNCAMNLHINLLAGKNTHHIIEGICKAFGQALDEAVQYDERITGTRSTKGVLEV